MYTNHLIDTQYLTQSARIKVLVGYIIYNESPVWPSALDPVSVDESSLGHIYCVHESPVWPSALDPVSVDESSVGHKYCIRESPVWPSALDPVSVDESSVGHIIEPLNVISNNVAF